MLRSLGIKIILLVLVIGSCYLLSSPILRNIASKATPGSYLLNGMKLTYSSNGEDSYPWTIANIEQDFHVKEMSNCTRIEISYAQNTPPESRIECALDDGYLMVKYDNTWQKSRPIKENMNLEVISQSGFIKAKYTTHQFSTISVGNHEFTVLETEIINYNSDGTIKNRLIEKYSIELSTAVEGVFHIPKLEEDSNWQIVNTFKLVKVSTD